LCVRGGGWKVSLSWDAGKDRLLSLSKSQGLSSPLELKWWLRAPKSIKVEAAKLS
jgi:hypothetical protein